MDHTDQKNAVARRTYLEKWLAELQAKIKARTDAKKDSGYTDLLSAQAKNIQGAIAGINKALSA